jgi:hypothetical protein
MNRISRDNFWRFVSYGYFRGIFPPELLKALEPEPKPEAPK